MHNRIILKISGKILLVVFLALISLGIVQAQSEGEVRNPLNVNGGADPWLTYYEGNYYLAATTWRSEWTMRKSPTLAGLKTALPQRIYFETDPSRCCNMWAPEFRLLEGADGSHWYFYYTSGTPGTYDNQRSHVLESEGTDPMGPYHYKARIFDPEHDIWSIDGSVMELDDQLYFLFSAFEAGKQSLFIAPMSNPWTISNRSMISQPEYPWELQGGNVNEGPVALTHDGQTFITYSASACSGPDYKLGMLTYNGGDPLSAASWDKNPEPVFQRSDENGVFAPGHHGFFQSPDGTEDWIVYHANDSVMGGCDGRRTTRVQRFIWNDDGMPNFGVPVSTTEVIAAPSGDTGIDPMPEFTPLPLSLFKTLRQPVAYLRHIDFLAKLDFVQNADAQFVVVPGLADSSAISIESSNFPGFFLRHQNNMLILSADDNSDTFEADVTWWIRPGIADPDLISFEAYSKPGNFIGEKFGVVALITEAEMSSEASRENATFVEEHLSP